MKKTLLILAILVYAITTAFSQSLTQTVRGTILDTDSKMPLIGATVQILGSDPIIGVVTDMQGNFKIENVPTGRINLQLSYMGYDAKTIPNIEVNSGREVVLNFNMQESAVQLEEVVVRQNKNKGEPLNDMALISSRSISVEETKRYAGGFDDPSRVVSNFAGVANSPNGGSDIIVRGNAPKYLRWHLEGMEMTSPYHFDDQNASFGGLSALNNNLLQASDFHTSAYTAEYGNVLSAIYDVNLRSGNNEKFEAVFGFGLLGTDITLEGPFRPDYAGSFLVNYRYSTAGLISDLGLIDIDADVSYQDLTFKFLLPTKSSGTFSIFGLGGLNAMDFKDIDPTVVPTASNTSKTFNIQEDYLKQNYLLNTGVNHVFTLSNSSFLKSSITYSSSSIGDETYLSERISEGEGEFEKVTLANTYKNFDNKLIRSSYRAAINYSNKINAKHKVQMGAKYTLFDYQFNQEKAMNGDSTLSSLVNFQEQASTINSFLSWKYRPNKNLTFVAGLHNMIVLLNNKSTLEPRVAMHYKLNHRNTLSAGYGLHSTMESIHHYYAKVEQEDGSITEPNKDLDLLKAHHFVVGYEKRFNQNLSAKLEMYYQHLFDLPVENNDTSYFSTINEGIEYRYVDLVNEGTGKNYGMELTVEKFFANNYFFMINGSVFNSSYRSLENVERNTRYNNNYLVNILAGKEWYGLGKKDNQTMAINVKAFFEGGQKYIPLLRDADGNLAVDPEKNRVWDYDKAFNNSLGKIAQLNLSFSYKFNRLKTTHELYLDLQNITNNEAKMTEYYDENEDGNIGYVTQFGFFPNLMYKVYF